MPAHRLSGFFRQAGGDRLRYRLVLLLDLAEIFAKAVRTAFKRANALPRNNQAAEKFEKFHEAIILRGQRDRLMERKILLDPALTTGNGADEDALRLPDGLDLRSRSALAGNRGRL